MLAQEQAERGTLEDRNVVNKHAYFRALGVGDAVPHWEHPSSCLTGS